MPFTGDRVASIARSKVGVPYFFGVKMRNLDEATMAKFHLLYPKIVTKRVISAARKARQLGAINTDDSGFVSSCLGVGRTLTSPQLHSQAYVRLPVDSYKEWADGVVCWNKKQEVGIFYKESDFYYVVTARPHRGVQVERFQKHLWNEGLTFFGIKYIYKTNLSSRGTWKRFNPYAEPAYSLSLGAQGEGVRWLQYELRECGYQLLATGNFDKKTEAAVRDFQKNSLLVIDGICGKQTKKALLSS